MQNIETVPRILTPHAQWETGDKLEHIELVGMEQLRGDRDKVKLRQREMELNR